MSVIMQGSNIGMRETTHGDDQLFVPYLWVGWL